MNVIGLVLTLVLGFFIIIGAFLMHIFENKERFLVISLSMAFGVMASLIFLELLPESFEIFNEKYNQPKQLRIKFFNQNPIEVFLERYEGRKRRCYNG